MQRVALLCFMCVAVVSARAQDQYAEATRKYFECAKSGIASLDDHQSDAATVAIGLYGLCRRAFANAAIDVQRENAMAEALRPHLIQMILAQRVADRKK
jgi:hypothetical protein